MRKGDIMKQDLKELCGGEKYKVVANLPYYITTPIVMKLLEENAAIESITIMIQKEVAQRMQTGPGSKDYGALSIGVQYYADPEIVCRAAPSCFMPQPKVASSVLRLVKRAVPKAAPHDPEHMFAVVKAAFLQRRKTLPNAIAGYAPLGLSREEAAAAMEKMGLDSRLRGETLTLEQFAALDDALQKN